MGDNNNDDWEIEKLNDLKADVTENEIDVNEDDNNYEEEKTIEAISLNQQQTCKNEKKKRKLSLLKEIIKSKKSNDTQEVTQDNKNALFFKSLKESSPLLKLFHPQDFLDATSLSNPNLPCLFRNAILTVIPGFKKLIKKSVSDVNGCPLVIIVSISAIRCTEICQIISTQIHCKIAKLFAKHIKMPEQIEMLNNSRYPIAIGTPNRLCKLLEYGALQLDKTKLLIIDTFADKKDFTVVTLPGVSDDFTLFMEKYISACPEIKLCCV